MAELVRERLAGTADEIQTDVMGSVHARLSGTGVAPSLMLSAHMDEIGLMVTYISDEGFLSVSSVGGVDAAILPGMRVDVHASNSFEPLRGVVGRKPIHLIEPDERKNVTPIDKLVIDLGMPAKRVKKLVMVGDVITFGVGFERFGKNMAVSRAFDDKAGVWVAVRVLETLAKEGRALFDLPPFQFPDWVTHSMHLGRELTPASFEVPAPEGVADGTVCVRAIEIIPAKVGTFEAHVDLPVVDGRLESDLEQDALKTFVFERHHETGTCGCGFVKGFGIKRGAMASTVAHDAHNLLVVGTNDEDMALAANTLAACGGGMTVVADGKVPSPRGSRPPRR